MEMKELLDGLAANLGIDSLAIVGGEAALDIDGMPVLLSEAQDDALLLSGLESGAYMLLKRLPKAMLDPESFAKELAAFADTLSDWRESLDSFRPAAAAAADLKRTEPALHLSPDAFIEP